LLKKSTLAREYYHHKFRYILVDEYQDTNHAQYLLVKLLTGSNTSLTVVGDSDQSIYAFRGATIRNILEFEKDFENTHTVLLEQNYRSVNNILEAANSVIDQNPDRKKKNLWSDKGEGVKIQGFAAHDGYDEANFICSKIKELVDDGTRWGDIAVFFRTNSASRSIEEKLVNNRIPYRLVGGTKFYDRMEIKDVLAYLYAVINRFDDIHVRRILNIPTRGIGKTTEERVAKFAWEHGCAFGDVFEMLDDVPDINSSARQKLLNFNSMLTQIADWIDNEEPELGSIVERVIKDSGYLEELEQSKDPQDQVRVENLDQLVQAATSFVPQQFDDDSEVEESEVEESEVEEISTKISTEHDVENNSDDWHQVRGRSGLEAFLEQVALIADADDIPDNSTEDLGMVTLMTLHTAKGLEFDNVFLTGFEDGTLPHANAFDSEFELQEERRLAYVGITRARERLFITWASRRNVFGNWIDFIPSRFANDIPDGVIEWIHQEKVVPENGDYDPWEFESGFGSRRQNYWNSKFRRNRQQNSEHSHNTSSNGHSNDAKSTSSGGQQELTPYQKYKLGIK
jgi:DNA helicase-2/ATP-dependent DNA helicase PcrA